MSIYVNYMSIYAKNCLQVTFPTRKDVFLDKNKSFRVRFFAVLFAKTAYPNIKNEVFPLFYL